MPETEIKKAEQKLIHWRMIVQSWVHSRKALLLIVSFVVASVALFVGRMDGGQWVDLIKWLVPAYMGANALAGCADAMGRRDKDDQ